MAHLLFWGPFATTLRNISRVRVDKALRRFTRSQQRGLGGSVWLPCKHDQKVPNRMFAIDLYGGHAWSSQSCWYSTNWGFLKIRGTLVGFVGFSIRIIVFGDLACIFGSSCLGGPLLSLLCVCMGMWEPKTP